MRYETLGKLMDKWTVDATFRAAVRRNPLAAIAAAGVELTAEEQETVCAVDWSLSDDELAARTSNFA